MGRIRSAVPGVEVALTYERRWLGRDVVAGLVLSAILIPQGMAYAELAGLPAVTGLYTSVLCLLGYALFGPSRILVLGPDSSLGPMIAATLAPLLLADGDPARAVALASVLALMVGLVPTDADGLVDEFRAAVRGVADGLVNSTSAWLGVGCLVALLVLRRVVPRLPGVLLVVAAAALIVYAADLVSQGVDTIGALPQGLPGFEVPTARWSDLPTLALGAMAIAVVALADTMSTASAFGARRGERVKGDQEMIGIGAANVAAGLFQGFAVSTSGSRTAVAEQAGARSQLAGVVGAVVIGVVLVVAGPVTEYIPQPTLAAIVIMAALALADVPAMARLWRRRRSEFAISLAALLGVALVGVLPGILIAIGLSILDVFRRVWWPHEVELGAVDGIAGLHDIERHPDATLVPGLAVYRFDAPLIFANARVFGDNVRAIIEERPDIRCVLLAAEPITDVDTTAADMLSDLVAWLAERGVAFAVAEMKDPVREKLERYELATPLPTFHPTIEEAVRAFTDGER